MHDTYGTEIYLKQHREDLEGQAEHERQITRAMRVLASKKTSYPERQGIRIRIETSQPRPYVLTIRI